MRFHSFSLLKFGTDARQSFYLPRKVIAFRTFFLLFFCTILLYRIPRWATFTTLAGANGVVALLVYLGPIFLDSKIGDLLYESSLFRYPRRMRPEYSITDRY